MSEASSETASVRRPSERVDPALVEAIRSRMSVVGLHVSEEANRRHEIFYRVSPDSVPVLGFELWRRDGKTICHVLRPGSVTWDRYANRRRDDGLFLSARFVLPDGDGVALGNFLERVSREVRTLVTANLRAPAPEVWQSGYVAHLDVSIDWIEQAARDLGLGHDHLLVRRLAKLSDTIRTAVLDDPNVAVHLGKASYKIAVFEAGQRLARSTPGIEDDEDLPEDTTPRSTAIPRM